MHNRCIPAFNLIYRVKLKSRVLVSSQYLKLIHFKFYQAEASVEEGVIFFMIINIFVNCWFKRNRIRSS